MNKFVGLCGLCLLVLTGWYSWGTENLASYASNEVIWTVLLGIILIALHLDIKETVKALNNKLEALAQRTANIEGRLSIPAPSPDVGADSPLTINESGRAFADRLKASDTAKRLADQVALPVNADDYELQSACLEFAEDKLFSLMTDEERSRLNEVAFQAGRTRESFSTLYGILLRDTLFKQSRERADPL